MICDGFNTGRMQFAPTRTCACGTVDINRLFQYAACCAPTRDKPYINVVPGSLGAIVRSFKSAVTKSAHEYRESPGAPIWQRNYYEHVIRNEADLFEKRKYIIDNPAKWNEDEYYSNESAGGFNK
jgi:hypothetical protein